MGNTNEQQRARKLDRLRARVVEFEAVEAENARPRAIVYAGESLKEAPARRRAGKLAAMAVIERRRLAQALDVPPVAVMIVAVDGPVRHQQQGDGSPFPSRELPLERAFLNGEIVRAEQLLPRNAVDGRDVPILANRAMSR